MERELKNVQAFKCIVMLINRLRMWPPNPRKGALWEAPNTNKNMHVGCISVAGHENTIYRKYKNTMKIQYNTWYTGSRFRIFCIIFYIYTRFLSYKLSNEYRAGHENTIYRKYKNTIKIQYDTWYTVSRTKTFDSLDPSPNVTCLN